MKQNLLKIEMLMVYGIEVFNNEDDKFQRWLKKPNPSLNNKTPDSLLDSESGINEVMICLNKINYGIFC